MKTVEELNEKYDLELNRVISEINNLKVTRKKKCKLVLLQFPDGLKPYATCVVDYLENKCKSVGFLIWFGDCFGACDTPVLSSGLNIDLVVQFGHNEMMPKI
ncbi:MAG: diphthamide synthesis protein [archaeon]